MLKTPVLSGIERSAGYDPAYFASGDHKTMSYGAWKDKQAREAKLSGRHLDVPERRPDGTIDGGGSHVASPDEIIDYFSKLGAMVARTAGDSEEAQEEARRATQLKELGELGKKAATGDAEAMEEAVKRSIEVLRATDPNILPQPYVGPADFLAEFPVPLDQTELITLCDETGLYRALPEVVKGSAVESWRELTQLEFVSGCDFIAFEEGGCPEEFLHDGGNLTETLRHIGVKKTLSESQILASAFSIQAGYGINQFVGGFNDQGLPGESDVPTLIRQNVTDVKDKEARLGSVLVLNAWDQLLVDGDNGANAEEFDGLATQITAANGARCNSLNTGTFNVNQFDQFLAAGCAHPQAIIGHPTALAQVSLAYYAIGSQTVFFDRNDNIVPGLHFAGELMTGIGPISLIADSRFGRRDNGDGTFNATVYPVRLTHNGEELIYKRTQIPLSFKDLVPGCSAISFQIYAVTALVVKAMCAQACYTADFAGLVDDGCTYIHPCITNPS